MIKKVIFKFLKRFLSFIRMAVPLCLLLPTSCSKDDELLNPQQIEVLPAVIRADKT
ncbi:MAG: hypothetical protein AB2L24_23655 [Mangrovibacterium sp.]